MFLLFTYSLSLFIFLLNFPPCTPTTTLPTWQNIDAFLSASRGSHVTGISDLKKYLHRFGHLLPRNVNTNFSDTFDSQFESAILRFQSKLSLPLTGKLDSETLSQISAPRCGVPDTDTLHGTKRYVHFPGKPRWVRHVVPMTLTYGFLPDNMNNHISQLSLSDIRDVFARAFSTWASVIPVSFAETEDYGFADIRIGFYDGDHGDGEPFDGVLGILAHSFSPESGRLHLDAAETWAVDFRTEKSAVAVDLESVVTHEIGHLLGLGHSNVREAVMYPSLKPREKKVDLGIDDVEGVQALYGSNHNSTVGDLSESDISTNLAVDFRTTTPSKWANFMILLLIICFCMHVI